MQRITNLWRSGRTGKIAVGCGGLIALLIVCSIFASLGGEGTSTPTATVQAVVKTEATARPELHPTNTVKPTQPPPSSTPGPTDTPEPTRTPGPTDTPRPTDTPEPTRTPRPTNTPRPTLAPAESLLVTVTDALSRSNRNIQRVAELTIEDETVFIQWAINDNLTEGMIKTGAKIDVADILETVAKSGIQYQKVELIGTFSMVDKFGNASEDPVIALMYERATIERINWENFLFDNVYDVADFVKIHPAFQD